MDGKDVKEKIIGVKTKVSWLSNDLRMKGLENLVE